jgi:hypothetical protein
LDNSHREAWNVGGRHELRNGSFDLRSLLRREALLSDTDRAQNGDDNTQKKQAEAAQVRHRNAFSSENDSEATWDASAETYWVTVAW